MKPYYFLWLMVTLLFGCNRKFDRPPTEGITDMQPTQTIKELKLRHVAGKFEKITDDAIIEGIVVADDKSGNFYQTIVIQDATGGIAVKIDGYNLYTSYPIGRKVYIKTQGLYLGEYGGMIQIGGGIDSSVYYRPSLSSIASDLTGQFIFKGSFNNIVTPKIILPNILTTDQQDSLQYTLVAFENMQFDANDVGHNLADTSRQSTSASFILQSCQGEYVTLRNSSYASFAGVKAPSGNGLLVAIYSCYNEDKQLAIRDTGDLQFYQTRCNEQPADTTKLVTIRYLKSLYKTSSVTIPYGTVIKATVISNDKNESSGNYKLQDTSGRGITLYGTNIVGLEFGKTYLFNISGGTLEMFGSELEITKIAPQNIFPSSPLDIQPRITTVQQVVDSITDWQCTLVKISNATVSAPTISAYGRTYGFMDYTGSLSSYVRSTAAFTIPQGSATSITGYASISQNAAQVVLRTAADVVANTSGGTPVVAANFTADYTFSGVTTSSGTVDPTSVPTVSGLTLGAFRAVGVDNNSSAAGRFSFSKWSTGATNGSNDFTGGINQNMYLEVTITPSSNVQLSLNNLVFTLQRSATGPRQWAIRSSLDNFAQNLPAYYSGTLVRVTGDNIFQIENRTTATAITGCNIALNNDFQNLTQPVTIRIYAFNAESTSGTFSLNKFTVNGSVQ